MKSRSAAYVLLVSLLAAIAAHPEDAPEPRRYALLVGCSEYPNLKARVGAARYDAQVRLPGAANDVALMRDTLTRYAGFRDADVRALIGWDERDPATRPTRDNILAALREFAAKSRPGDRVFVQFSGHGSQQADTDGDEMDGRDEIFLPADIDALPSGGGSSPVPKAIVDDELNGLVRAIRDAGAFVWLVADCCHSGTLLRGEAASPVRFRGLDPGLLGVRFVAGRVAGGTVEESDSGDLRGIVAMYGAQSYRPAPEFILPEEGGEGRDQGLLTFTIATQLARLTADVTYEEFFARVLASYQVRYKATVPQVEGAVREATVRGSAAGEGPVLLASGGASGPVLNAGSLSGIGAGAVVEVFRPGGFGAEAARLGYLRVTHAGLAESACEPLARGGLTVPALEGDLAVCPARVVESPLEGRPVRIAITAPDGRALGLDALPPAARGALSAEDARRKFPVAASVAGADWLVTVKGDALLLRPAASGDELPFESSAEGLLDLLGRVYRADNLLRLAERRAGAEAAPRVDLHVARPGRPEEPLREGEPLRPGDTLVVKRCNDTGATFDLWVFHLDSDLALTPLFPRAGQSPRLDPTDTAEVSIGRYSVTEDSNGAEHLVVIAVPREAGSPPVYLDFLAQPPARRTATRGDAGGGVAGLLEGLAFGGRTRGASDRDFAATLAVRTWRCEWGTLSPPADFGGTPVAAVAPTFTPLPLARPGGDFEPDGDVEDAPRAVALVRTREGFATGVRVGSTGDALTALSAVSEGYGYDEGGRRTVTVEFPGGMPEAATVVLTDARLGLALLRPAGNPSRGLEVAAAGPAVGDELTLAGHPESDELWSDRETVAGSPIAADPRLFAIGGEAAAGEAGAPLLDAEGRLRGLVVGPSVAAGAPALREFLARAPAAGAVLPPDVPDPWELAARVSRAKSDPASPRPDLLLSGGDRPDRVWIDFDGDSREGGAPRDGFDAEIALFFRPDRRLAFYDTDNDGTFDLVLVDSDGDPEADGVFRLGGGAWGFEGQADRPFLRVAYVKSIAVDPKAWIAAMKTLSRFRVGR